MATKITTLRPDMVFPTTKLEPVNKIISEGNLTRLINNILDLDSYIIPFNDPYFHITNTQWDSTLGRTMVRQNEVDPSSVVEIMLHGYYFNLGTFQSLAGAFTSNSQRLIAKIIVDTTVENYPELFGERADTTTVTIPGNVTDNTTLDEAYRKKDIIEISAVGDDNVTYYFTLDDDWKLVLINTGSSEPVFTNGYSITYATYYNLISLWVLNEGEEDVPVDEQMTLPSSYEEYSLEVLCKDSSGNYGFILRSFPKFMSSSVTDIDGGEI